MDKQIHKHKQIKYLVDKYLMKNTIHNKVKQHIYHNQLNFYSDYNKDQQWFHKVQLEHKQLQGQLELKQ
jgi:hypothetical protein